MRRLSHLSSQIFHPSSYTSFYLSLWLSTVLLKVTIVPLSFRSQSRISCHGPSVTNRLSRLSSQIVHPSPYTLFYLSLWLSTVLLKVTIIPLSFHSQSRISRHGPSVTSRLSRLSSQIVHPSPYTSFYLSLWLNTMLLKVTIVPPSFSSQSRISHHGPSVTSRLSRLFNQIINPLAYTSFQPTP